MADRILAVLNTAGIRGTDAETALAAFRAKPLPRPTDNLMEHYGLDAIRVALTVLEDARRTL